ncbi:nucleoside phosphorylase [Streptomyces clavuligerus]|nr:nucleoside phosphorylase [Streptomyces clavuligerus]WDN56890.1 nucleoside phosphorylase [Streptomyces clavuligerus]
MPLPADKHRLPALTDPAEHAAHIRTRRPDADLAHTAGVVLLYQSSLIEEVTLRIGTHPVDRWVSADLHLSHDNVVLCSGFGRGAPAAGLIIEQLIAFGARAVITIGTAATLAEGLHPGDLVICRDALRGEGLSHHYLAPGRYITPDTHLTGLLAAEIDGNGARVRQERVWTTDALYRETATEVQQFTAEGAMAADMEAAGVLAVAHFRHIPAAAAFAIADSLVCRTPRHDSPKTHKGLVTLFDAAVRTLTRRLPSPAGADSRSPRARGLSPGTPPEQPG